MKLKECKEGYYKIDNYRICEVIPTVNKGTWVEFYEAWSDDTYKFVEKSNLRGITNIEVTPIKARKEGYRVCLL